PLSGPCSIPLKSCGCDSSVLRPSEVARRFAGSIVMTTAFLPSIAARMASTALSVVLPTPPLPQQISTRWSWMSLSIIEERAVCALSLSVSLIQLVPFRVKVFLRFRIIEILQKRFLFFLARDEIAHGFHEIGRAFVF